MSQNNSQPDSLKINSLPDDLKDLAKDLIAKKFDLPREGQVMAQKAAPNMGDGWNGFGLGSNVYMGTSTGASNVFYDEYSRPTTAAVNSNLQMGQKGLAILEKNIQANGTVEIKIMCQRCRYCFRSEYIPSTYYGPNAMPTTNQSRSYRVCQTCPSCQDHIDAEFRY